MSKLDDALEYAALGWSVFPIDPTSKRPRTPNGYHDATADSTIVHDHWIDNAEDNIGMPMRPNGMICIDVDPRNGGDVTFARCEQLYGPLPRTRWQRSASGGMHIMLRDIADRRPRGKLDYLGHGKGVDVKCNGYVLVEGSTNSAGDRYEWLALDPAILPDIPATWLDLLYYAPTSEDAPEGLGIAEWESSTDGPLSVEDAVALKQALRGLGERKGGNSTTFRAMRLIFHDYGLGIDDGWPYLAEWNEHCGTPHPQHELERRVLNAASVEADTAFGHRGRSRKSVSTETRIARAGVPDVECIVSNTPASGQNSFTSESSDEEGVSAAQGTVIPGSALTPTSLLSLAPALPPPVEHAPGTYLAVLTQAIDDVASYTNAVQDDSSERPYFLPGSQLFRNTDRPPAWLVESLIIEGGNAVLATEPKSAKTWLATEIAVAVATGTKVVGRFDSKPGAVAYFYTEDLGEAINTRVRSLLAGRGLTTAAIARTFHAQPRGRDIDITKLEDCARLIASTRLLADEGGPVKLLVLDPLRNIHTSEEDKADAMSAVFRNLRMVGKLLDCTILLVHHSAKASENTSKRRPGQRMRGSGAIHGFVDSGIYLEDLKTPDSATFTNVVKSEVKAARSAGVFELTLKIVDDPRTHSAVKATWETGTVGETAATEDQTDSWRSVALDIVDAFAMNKLKGQGSTMPTRLVAKVIKGKAATIQIALKLACQEQWLKQDKSTQTYHITAKGEAISRQRNSSPEPVVPTEDARGTFSKFAE